MSVEIVSSSITVSHTHREGWMEGGSEGSGDVVYGNILKIPKYMYVLRWNSTLTSPHTHTHSHTRGDYVFLTKAMDYNSKVYIFSTVLYIYMYAISNHFRKAW